MNTKLWRWTIVFGRKWQERRKVSYDVPTAKDALEIFHAVTGSRFDIEQVFCEEVPPKEEAGAA